MDVIDRINVILKERGMTGADLSRKIGVSTAVYSQWNKKKTKPSNKNLLKVAEVLDVPVSELIDDKQKTTTAAGDGNKDAVMQEIIDLVKSLDIDRKKVMLEMAKILTKMEK